MKIWTLAACTVATALACGAASAQFRSPDDAIEYRQGALGVLGHHFGVIGQMVSGKIPFDAHAAQVNADLVATLARLPWSAFVEGSDKGDTNAKPEIWSQPDKFKTAANRLQDAAAKLAEAAKSGNQAAVRTAFDATADSCKSCHDDFRRRH